MSDRILFVLKQRQGYWGDYSMSSGLLNSCTFVQQMLVQYGIEAKLVEVVDNNTIDREIQAYNPTKVIVEAYWVVPEKFDVLRKLHPMIHWIVRNHSEMPFLANEGISMEWTYGYLKRDIEVMCNSPRAISDFQRACNVWGLNDRLVTYGPNYYPMHTLANPAPPEKGTGIDIGCFGAIRPLKNHLGQAFAAADFGRLIGEKVRFHINATRFEGSGTALETANTNPILKNLQAFFASCVGAELVEHPWVNHETFLGVIAGMDAMMQVSFSETYNIVAADGARMRVPLIVSSEVPWIGTYAHADPTSPQSMMDVLDTIWKDERGRNHRLSRQHHDLAEYNRMSARVWMERFPNRPGG